MECQMSITGYFLPVSCFLHHTVVAVANWVILYPAQAWRNQSLQVSDAPAARGEAAQGQLSYQHRRWSQR
jgi:hypothetical protein